MPGIAFQRLRRALPYIPLVKSIEGECFIYGVDPQPAKGFWLRHDEDWSLEFSLRLARLEHKHGLRATYFLNHTCDYFDYSDTLLGACRELLDLGHDIGLHTNVLEEHLVSGRPPDEILRKPLSFFDDNDIVITGVAAHGSKPCSDRGLLNCEIWKEFEFSPYYHMKAAGKFDGALPFERLSLADYGLKYDAAFLDHDAFISDSSGRLWGVYKNVAPGDNRVYDLVEYGELLQMHRVIKNNVDEVIEYYNQNMDGAFLQVLIHPRWWIPPPADIAKD
jgi:hypothetical protein